MNKEQIEMLDEVSDWLYEQGQEMRASLVSHAVWELQDVAAAADSEGYKCHEPGCTMKGFHGHAQPAGKADSMLVAGGETIEPKPENVVDKALASLERLHKLWEDHA